jgi:hypothetical protein
MRYTQIIPSCAVVVQILNLSSNDVIANQAKPKLPKSGASSPPRIHCVRPSRVPCPKVLIHC